MGKDAAATTEQFAIIPGKLPDIGTIVWCYVNYTSTTGGSVRHALRHPALVLDHAKDESAVDYLVIAGGASAVEKDGSARRLYSSDFVVRIGSGGYKRHGGIDQLTHDTKFSLAQKDIFVLPYTQQFFYCYPGMNSPRVGTVIFEHQGVKQKFDTAALAANLEKTLADVLGEPPPGLGD